MQTRRRADSPTLFAEDQFVDAPALFVPVVSSENRRYIPMGFVNGVVINNKALFIPNCDLYTFGTLTSSIHMAWVRTVAGLLEMRYSYGVQVVYNTFPWCTPTDKQHAAIEAAIKTLRGIVSVRITSDDLNRHNNLLNFKNGVVDLQTGKFYDDVDPKLLITQQCNAIFRPDYRNETIDKFLRDILPDEPTRAALIRFLAYATTGECSEERALFCNGDGGNGKGTLTKTTLLLFGSYATTLKTSAVLLTGRTQDAGAATTELNPLEDCRLAIVEELPQGGKLDVAKFKNLTGGDLIPIRRLHHILSGNYLPELSDTRDPGLLRRLMNIHFTQSFIGDKRNPHLKEQLASADALSGFLSLIVNDAKLWYR